MVNYGPSRACETCKRRRKKCDGIRPFCDRCAKAGIPCQGYKSSSEVSFRYYVGAGESASDPVGRPSTIQPSFVKPPRALPVSLPPALPLSLPPTQSAPVRDDADIERTALNDFFNDYCVSSRDMSVSRGFLDGLETLIAHSGPSSDVAQAARLVTLAAAGNRERRTALLQKTKHLYGDLLRSFQRTLSRPVPALQVQSLMTAVLLGLYEIVTSTESNPGQHLTHVRGVAAILYNEETPYDLSAGTHFFQIGNPLLLKGPLEQVPTLGVLCAPVGYHTVQNLDAILSKLNPLLVKSTELLSEGSSIPIEEIQRLYRETLALDREFSQWSADQFDQWRPKSIGIVGTAYDQNDGLADYWPGNVDTYFDLFVAAVWNSYRKAHILALDIVFKCLGCLSGNNNHPRELEEARKLAEGIARSVPYHLTNDPQGFVERLRQGSPEKMAPGRPVGGLLMMHPLYVAARAPVVAPQLRKFMNERLSWIGEKMGIGQASLLSNPAFTLPFQIIAEGQILIWAGMLIQRDTGLQLVRSSSSAAGNAGIPGDPYTGSDIL